ncbi:MAG: MFS transporter, partial [Gammaproteobacteria bacterium]|nr:MFS transporter [Gammaproteobacteria bacterium]
MNQDNSIKIKAFTVWFAASLFACFQFCAQIILGPMTADLMGTYNLDAVSVSYVVSSFFYIYLLMQLPAGMLLDRYPTKYVMPITCFICALGVILMGLATNAYLFVVARMICGFGSAFGFIGTMRVLRNYFTIRHMTLFIGFTEMMGFLLTAACAHAVSYFLPSYGFKNVLFYFGFIGIFIVVLMIISTMKRFAPKYQYAPPMRHDLKLILQDFRALITDRQMTILGLISFSFFSLVTAFAALWGVPSLMNLHGLSLQQSTQAISCIFFGIATGGPLIGYLHLRIKNYCALIALCGIVSAILV